MSQSLLSSREQGANLLPTPLATAALGLLFCAAVPGGYSGGQGFVIGMLVGFVISVIAALRPRVSEEAGRVSESSKQRPQEHPAEQAELPPQDEPTDG